MSTLDAHRLRVDNNVRLNIGLAVLHAVVTAAMTYLAATELGWFWIAAALFAVATVGYGCSAYFWAKAAWYRAEADRLRAERRIV